MTLLSFHYVNQIDESFQLQSKGFYQQLTNLDLLKGQSKIEKKIKQQSSLSMKSPIDVYIQLIMN